MKFMNEMFAKVMSKVVQVKNDESGSQTLEWVGIAAVIIIAVGLVSTAFSSSTFGTDVVTKFTGFLSKIGGE